MVVLVHLFKENYSINSNKNLNCFVKRTPFETFKEIHVSVRHKEIWFERYHVLYMLFMEDVQLISCLIFDIWLLLWKDSYLVH